MTRQVVPISDLSRRLPEAGRIRAGVKTGKAMKALSNFRFTSHDETALGQLAEMYGGDVVPWSEPKAAAGQFELITTSPEIRVVLPPDPLGGTPIYELWSGGGCERRCDGVTAQVLQQGQDGLENVDVPCLCSAKGEVSCNVITRLSVIIPEVKFAGVWRLDTKSWNAAQDLPGMVDMVQSTMQTHGLSYALLGLQQKRSVQAGETRRFTVPVLSLPVSIETLAAGGSRLGELPSQSLPELGTGAEHVEIDPAGSDVEEPMVAPALSDDDEIHDAEIIEDAPCSVETWSRIVALKDLPPTVQEDMKAWIAAKGWTFTKAGLSEAQALQVVEWAERRS